MNRLQYSCTAPLTHPVQVRGLWNESITLGSHNVDPTPSVRFGSINWSDIKLTNLGFLVRTSKYDLNSEALNKLVHLAEEASRFFLSIKHVFFIPPRDSTSKLTEEIGRAVSRTLGISNFKPALNWDEFEWFQKGDSINQIKNNFYDQFNVSNSPSRSVTRFQGRPDPEHRILIVDDTVWSGSTLNLATLYRQYVDGPSVTSIFVLTEVLSMGDIGNA